MLYRLKRRWRNGTTHVLLEPLELVEKLAALVPPPRFHRVRYHGLLARPLAGELLSSRQRPPGPIPSPIPVARPRARPKKVFRPKLAALEAKGNAGPAITPGQS